MKKTISGIRGIIGDDLTIADIMTFCRNFAAISGSRCVTGIDTRPSSELVSRAAHAALMSAGVDVYALGVVPTPVVFREARRTGAGIVITSSHNPLEWNGLKFVLRGRGINESELPSITGTGSRIYNNGKGSTGSAPGPGDARIGAEIPHVTSYVDEAAAVIGRIDDSPRIIADVGGGAAAETVRQLYQKIGCSINVINTEPCSRGPDPTTDPLYDLVRDGPKYDAGFAFDLDGDRLVTVIGGSRQPPDVTLGLCVAAALDRGCRRFVLSTDTSTGVEQIITSRGAECTRAKVGEANVVDEMIRVGAQAGGEGSSGGFILSEFNHCRDGILAGGMIAGMLKEGGGKRSRLGDVLRVLGSRHITRTKVQARLELHDEMIGRAKTWMESLCSKVQELDGIKGITNGGEWVLVRRSNTEDVIRISAESRDEAGCARLIGEISAAMGGR